MKGGKTVRKQIRNGRIAEQLEKNTITYVLERELFYNSGYAFLSGPDNHNFLTCVKVNMGERLKLVYDLSSYISLHSILVSGNSKDNSQVLYQVIETTKHISKLPNLCFYTIWTEPEKIFWSPQEQTVYFLLIPIQPDSKTTITWENFQYAVRGELYSLPYALENTKIRRLLLDTNHSLSEIQEILEIHKGTEASLLADELGEIHSQKSIQENRQENAVKENAVRDVERGNRKSRKGKTREKKYLLISASLIVLFLFSGVLFLHWKGRENIQTLQVESEQKETIASFIVVEETQLESDSEKETIELESERERLEPESEKGKKGNTERETVRKKKQEKITRTQEETKNENSEIMERENKYPETTEYENKKKEGVEETTQYITGGQYDLSEYEGGFYTGAEVKRIIKEYTGLEVSICVKTLQGKQYWYSYRWDFSRLFEVPSSDRTEIHNSSNYYASLFVYEGRQMGICFEEQ